MYVCVCVYVYICVSIIIINCGTEGARAIYQIVKSVRVTLPLPSGFAMARSAGNVLGLCLFPRRRKDL